MTIRTIPCAIALACAANFACAQDSAVETITVTGSRLPVNLSDLAASVTVLNEADIQASGATQLTDLLRGMPGISISQSGSPGALAELRLRGSETNHLLVLIDGVIVNDLSQGGLVDFAHLTAANIAKVELLRGAQSALWGSGAVAGVVSITTKGHTQPSDSASLSAAAGNGGTYRGAVSASHNVDNLSASFYANRFKTDGDNVSRTGTEDDGYRNTTAGASLNWQLASQHSLSASVRVVDYQNDYDATDFSTGLPADADNVTDGKQLTSSVQWHFSVPQLGYRSEIKAQYHKDDNDNLTDGVDAGGTTGERKQLNWTHFFDADVANFAIGAELLKREFEQRGPATYGDPNYRGDDNTSSVFAELTGWGTEQLSTQFSLRYDDNERFDKAWSYRAGARYSLTRQVSVFTSVSQAVKTPSFTELYGYYPASFIGNPELQPEQSREYELGLSSAFTDELSAQLSVYSTRLEQEIVSIWDADSGLSSVANTTEDSRRDGFEASVEWVADTWQLTAHYTYLDASQGDGSNQTVELRRPNHTGSIIYRHSLPVQGLSAYIKADYTGVRKDTFYPPWPASAQTLDLDPYWLVSMNVSYALTTHWDLGLRVDNALAQEYEDIVGYSGTERRYLAQASYRF
ncbi:TonB-dependent receptor plug domain-containing protein [Alteromonas gilva]|uniref:TonB-dependent receptor n=1 Tax=Alteromonas gilva TaxID=2987522 RepID=A0ABT5L0J8_9ALTE|nr:TonB-dependent receptor [Alteromonas gilva]MDC8829959.1 TonB-dependent receptor [Alteromonas gilva]